jgi:hypothetical protein
MPRQARRLGAGPPPRAGARLAVGGPCRSSPLKGCRGEELPGSRRTRSWAGRRQGIGPDYPIGRPRARNRSPPLGRRPGRLLRRGAPGRVGRRKQVFGWRPLSTHHCKAPTRLVARGEFLHRFLTVPRQELREGHTGAGQLRREMPGLPVGQGLHRVQLGSGDRGRVGLSNARLGCFSCSSS